MNQNAQIVVETAVELPAEQAKELKALLKKKFGTESYEEKVNASLLGGLRITVGATQYDASLLGKLNQLRGV